MENLYYSDLINERLKEIDKEIAKLYQERRFLEMQQQEEWRRRNWTGPITATVDDDHTKICYGDDSEDNLDSFFSKFSKRINYGNGNFAFDDEWSGTLGD